MSIASLIFDLINWAYFLLYIVIGMAGLVGAVLALLTRDDAFQAADRQPKAVWVALLFVSAIVLIIPSPALSMFTWVGAVIVGLYWFDVRPQIKNILNGHW